MENSRETADSFGRIHFIREGNFYRAHDWSAWLMVTFPLTPNQPKINPIAKHLKDGYIDVFIGFPLTSLEKYIPNDGSVTFVPIGDDRIDVLVTLTDDVATADFNTVRKAVDEWKQTIPVSNKQSDRRDRETREQAPRAMRLTDVIGRLLSFPLESRSPMEAYDFLRQLRNDVAAFI